MIIKKQKCDRFNQKMEKSLATQSNKSSGVQSTSTMKTSQTTNTIKNNINNINTGRTTIMGGGNFTESGRKKSISSSGFIQTSAGQYHMNKNIVYDSDDKDSMEGDIRKSRIFNLPNHKKTINLTAQMTVVLQTIQIERLSVQIETLIISLMDSERQMNNFKSYQIQIRELNQKVYEYEKQRNSYLQEIEKLNLICQQLYAQLEEQREKNNAHSEYQNTVKAEHQNALQKIKKLEKQQEKWKHRYVGLQNSKEQQLQDLRLSLESQRKSTLNRQINSLVTKHQSERGNLQKQIFKLRQKQNSLKQQVQSCRQTIEHKQIKIDDAECLYEQLKEKENRFQLLEREFMKMSEMLQKQQEQEHQYIKEQQQNSRKVKDYQRKFNTQFKQIQGKVTSLQKENKRLQEEAIKNELQVEKLSKLKDRQLKYQKLLEEAGNQIDRLNKIIKDKIKYIEGWNQKYNQLINEFNASTEQNSHANKSKQDLCINLEKQLLKEQSVAKMRLQQVEQLKRVKMKLESQVKKYTDKYKSQCLKTEKDNNQLKYELNSMNEYKKEYEKVLSELEGEQQQRRVLEKEKMPELVRQIKSLSSQNQRKANELQLLETKLKRLEQSYSSKESVEQQLSILNKKNNQMIKFVDQLNNIIVEKSKELKTIKDALLVIDNNVSKYQLIQDKLRQIIRDKQTLFEQLLKERQDNNKWFQGNLEKDNQLFRLEKQLEQTRNQKEVKNREIGILQSQKEYLEKEVDEHRELLREISDKERQLREKWTATSKQKELLAQETIKSAKLIEKLNSVSKSTEQQNESKLKKALVELDSNKKKYQKLKQQYYQLKTENKKLQLQNKEIKEEWQAHLKQYNKQKQCKEKEYQRETELIKSNLSMELEYIKKQAQQYRKQLFILQNANKQFSNYKFTTDLKVKKLEETIKNLEHKRQLYQNNIQQLTENLKAMKTALNNKEEQIQLKLAEQQKIKKSSTKLIESKQQEFGKYKKSYEKYKKQKTLELTNLTKENDSLTNKLKKTIQQKTHIEQQLQQVLRSGRNSNEFLNEFQKIKIQSESIKQLNDAIIGKYFSEQNTKVDGNKNKFKSYCLQSQIPLLKQMITKLLQQQKQNKSLNQNHVTVLIQQNEKIIDDYNILKADNQKLSDAIISIQGDNKILVFEIERLIQHQKQKEEIFLKQESMLLKGIRNNLNQKAHLNLSKNSLGNKSNPNIGLSNIMGKQRKALTNNLANNNHYQKDVYGVDNSNRSIGLNSNFRIEDSSIDLNSSSSIIQIMDQVKTPIKGAKVEQLNLQTERNHDMRKQKKPTNKEMIESTVFKI